MTKQKMEGYGGFGGQDGETWPTPPHDGARRPAEPALSQPAETTQISFVFARFLHIFAFSRYACNGFCVILGVLL